MTKMKTDIISSIIKESEAYSSMSIIESYVAQGMELSLLPAQPLYLCMKAMPVDKAAKYLAHFTPNQRKVFYNLDIWSKDVPTPDNFQFWLKANSLVMDDNLKSEFVKSDEFLLFLKTRFNIWTFDVEDPMYPEHDNYFLTEDNLLLFEFEEGYEYLDEVRDLIKHLYFIKGVENAYSFLFKLVQEDFLYYQEQMFDEKKELLREYGFVDYFDALKFISAFPNLEVLNNYIRKKQGNTGEIDILGKQQSLHGKSLISFKDKVGFLTNDLAKIEDEKRLSFLQFNFIQLVNGTMALNDSLKVGPVAMTRTGEVTRTILELGHDYINNRLEGKGSIFEFFEFDDLYRVGHSLLYYIKKDLKKALDLNVMESDQKESFFGQVWIEYLDLSFEEVPKYHAHYGQKEKASPVNNEVSLKRWKSQSQTFIETLPFIKKFYETFSQLKEEGVLQDNYYMNYTVDEIDFEAVLLSSLGNFLLGNFEQGSGKKLGLLIKEFRDFAKHFINNEKVEFNSVNKKTVDTFMQTFGFDKIFGFQEYLESLIENHLEGYDYENLSDEDFRHVGGPIILSAFH